MLTGQIAEKQVEIDIASDLSALQCDRARMTRVLQNLIDNAVKFMGAQPDPHIWIGAYTEKSGSIFFVRDNGHGIPQDEQDRVFGLFNKLDPQKEGSGIGLALVKRIVESHGGGIWVESG